MEDEALDKEVLSLIEKGEVGVPFAIGVGGEGTLVRYVVVACWLVGISVRFDFLEGW
jgi:hypothetical protein